MDDDQLVELEMAYEPYSTLHSCLDMHITPEGSLRECRRSRNHEGRCASGFLANGTFVRWEHSDTESATTG